MVFVIKTKRKCGFSIPIIFLKQDISKVHLAQVMYFYSVNLMLGYNFLLTKYLLQKVKECKIWTFSVLLPWPSQTSQMWTEQNQLNIADQWRTVNTTTKIFQIICFGIYSIASEKSKKLYCCKFIKITNVSLEPNVWLVAKC